MKGTLLAIAFTLCFGPCFLFAKVIPQIDGTRGIEATRYAVMMHEKHMKELPRQALAARTQAVDMWAISRHYGDQKTLISPNPFDLSGKKFPLSRTAWVVTT